MHTQQPMFVSRGPRSTGPELASFHLTPSRPLPCGSTRRVCIATADTAQHRHGANHLLQQRYSWRGYRTVRLPPTGVSEHLPLTATRDGTVIGTLTVGFDSARGLNCDRSFARELQGLRAAGQRLCEFTKLAVQAGDSSVHVLAALFHVAFLAACNLHRVDTVLLEVNPRHVRYYQRMLGAEVLGQERANALVDAPAVLLALPSALIRRQIDQAWWPQAAPPSARSLYAQAFNRAEESAIVARLNAQMAQARQGEAQHAFSFRLPAVKAHGAQAA